MTAGNNASIPIVEWLAQAIPRDRVCLFGRKAWDEGGIPRSRRKRNGLRPLPAAENKRVPHLSYNGGFRHASHPRRMTFPTHALVYKHLELFSVRGPILPARKAGQFCPPRLLGRFTRPISRERLFWAARAKPGSPFLTFSLGAGFSSCAGQGAAAFLRPNRTVGRRRRRRNFGFLRLHHVQNRRQAA